MALIENSNVEQRREIDNLLSLLL